jgi:hypothetical protein
MKPDSTPGNIDRAEGRPLSRNAHSPGRLGTYATMGVLAGSVPLPWVPDAIARRLRGAMVHDVAARHGLSITPEARKVLCEPSGMEGPRGLLGQAIKFAAGKALARFGPLALVQPFRTGLATFILGHLFQRYLDAARTDRAVRIDVDEARRVRQAIDQALVHMITAEVRPAPDDASTSPEDLRDPTTAVFDSAFIAAASLPSWFLRRLEAAFDDVYARARP